MATAKAWRFTKRGLPADVLHLEDITVPALPPPLPFPKDVPMPEEWLIIKVSYTALNPGSQMQLNILPSFTRAGTCVPEMDFAGTVVDVWIPEDGKARRFSKGDEVVGFLPITHTYPTGNGALASHIRVPARYVVKKPKNTSMEESAGLLCTACTAWTLATEAGLKSEDQVLIHGASGGVGSAAVQLAKYIVGDQGLVVAVCSGRNAEMVRGLGAHDVIDYTESPDVSEELARRFSSSPFDVILDCAGNQQVYVNSVRYMKSKVYVACSVGLHSWTPWNFLKAFWRIQMNTYWPTSPWVGGTGKIFKLVAMMDPGVEMMEKMVQLVETGKLRVRVDSVWPAKLALSGYEILTSGRARGKVVIKWE